MVLAHKVRISPVHMVGPRVFAILQVKFQEGIPRQVQVHLHRSLVRAVNRARLQHFGRSSVSFVSLDAVIHNAVRLLQVRAIINAQVRHKARSPIQFDECLTWCVRTHAAGID